MEDNSAPVSWQWQCGHVSAGTTGQWCPCGAHQRSITLNYHNHNERITGLQHCYGLVTTLLQPRANMPVFRSSHAERDTVTRDTLTSVHLDSRWRRGWLHQEEESTTSGDVLSSWIVSVLGAAYIQNGYQQCRQRMNDVVWRLWKISLLDQLI